MFVAWLCELAANGMLCGLPLTIRFVGLFDTVASVGVPNAPASTYNLTNGHMSWAQPQWLRMPAAVKNCLHLAAMHENRAAFPVELLRTGGGLPANCQEFAFPGMHSDVGGGYAPDDQGRGTLQGSLDERDSEKLSQVSLSIMLRAAQAAGSPMDTSNAVSQTSAYNPFLVHDKIKAAYQNFHGTFSGEARQMGNWLLAYLAWRYQVRDRYAQLPWRRRANAEDIDALEGANALLRNDIAALDNTNSIWKQMYAMARTASSPWGMFVHNDLGTVRRLAPEAREVLQRIRAYPAVSDAEAQLFSTYLHDSVAGFRPWDRVNQAVHAKVVSPYLLLEGYLRYRRFWTGDNQALTLAIEPPDPDSYEEKAKAMQQEVNMKGYGVQDMFPPGGWR
ncbi:phospholipase effector Tle1 domain-containing protein [Dyella terrae]|uniref:phospholipase effector Tle1 domain-containing protein n=1 Tax=Dyella terrae TaxID=522259 RepID=UPI001EFD9926|nr:DUF2235 domain-containing protein [Dyella terrae]